MGKYEEFMKTILKNITRAGIDLSTHKTISINTLQKGVKTYFDITTDKTAKKHIGRLVDLGYLKESAGGFDITDLAMRETAKTNPKS